MASFDDDPIPSRSFDLHGGVFTAASALPFIRNASGGGPHAPCPPPSHCPSWGLSSSTRTMDLLRERGEGSPRCGSANGGVDALLRSWWVGPCRGAEAALAASLGLSMSGRGSCYLKRERERDGGVKKLHRCHS
jgi:hypothetical protein